MREDPRRQEVDLRNGDTYIVPDIHKWRGHRFLGVKRDLDPSEDMSDCVVVFAGEEPPVIFHANTYEEVDGVPGYEVTGLVAGILALYLNRDYDESRKRCVILEDIDGNEVEMLRDFKRRGALLLFDLRNYRAPVTEKEGFLYTRSCISVVKDDKRPYLFSIGSHIFWTGPLSDEDKKDLSKSFVQDAVHEFVNGLNHKFATAYKDERTFEELSYAQKFSGDDAKWKVIKALSFGHITEEHENEFKDNVRWVYMREYLPKERIMDEVYPCYRDIEEVLFAMASCWFDVLSSDTEDFPMQKPVEDRPADLDGVIAELLKVGYERGVDFMMASILDEGVPVEYVTNGKFRWGSGVLSPRSAS